MLISPGTSRNTAAVVIKEYYFLYFDAYLFLYGGVYII